MENLESTNASTTRQDSGVPVVPLPRLEETNSHQAVEATDLCRSSEDTAGGCGADSADHDVKQFTEFRISARRGWQVLDLHELYANRDLFRFLVRREIKVRYAQSAIGVGWAILQPLFTMFIFTVIFGRLANISSDGVPYALFSFAGLIPWMYFSNGATDGVNCLIANSYMLSKVYFPRMFLPLSAVAARFIDFSVAGLVLAGLMAWYGYAPNWGLLVLPWILALMVLTTSGVTLWLSTLAIQFRDVKHALGFVVQILMYSAPVVYPASLIPERYQLWYGLNPMVGVIEGLRAALLGTRDMPWGFLVLGTIVSLLIAGSGMLYFSRRQTSFADVA